MKQAF